MKLLNSSFFLTTLGTYDMINLMGASQPRQGRPNFVPIWLNISASIMQIKKCQVILFISAPAVQIQFDIFRRPLKFDKIFKFHSKIVLKGQLILKCPFGVKTSSKKPTKGHFIQKNISNYTKDLNL